VAADDADALYGLPLDAFVAERDALAKRLRADGRREEADEAKALRKPSVAAWAVNQVVRSQPKPARALWKSGDALIAAQDDLLAGRADAATLRTAVEDERAALDALLDAARGLLTGEGHDLGDATIERVRDTLHAGAIDAEAREEVAAGRAVRERAHAGLGAFGGAPPVAPAGRGGGAKAPDGGEADGRARTPKARGGAAAEKQAPPKQASPKGRAPRGAAKGKTPTKAEVAAAEKRDAAARRDEERKAAAERVRERREAARAKADAETELREARKALDKAQRAAGRANDRLADAQATADQANAALDAAQAREAAAVEALERAGKRSR